MEIKGFGGGKLPQVEDMPFWKNQQVAGIEGEEVDAGKEILALGETQINHLRSSVPNATEYTAWRFIAFDIRKFLKIEKETIIHGYHSTTGRASVKTRIGPRHPEYDHLLTKILHIFESWSGFSFFLMVSVALLWVIGNLQAFTSDTQASLLQILEVVGYFAVGINFYALLLLVLWGVRHHSFPGWRIGLSLFSLLIGVSLTFMAALIGVFLKPVW